MKVSLLAYDLSGGPFTLGYAALAKGLFANGVDEVEFAYLDKSMNGDLQYLFPPAVRFVKLAIHRSRWAAFGIAKYLKEHQPTVCISMPCHLNIPTIIGWSMVGKPRPRLIVSERAMLSHTAYVQNPHSMVWRSLPYLVRTFYPHSSGVVCNSPDVAEDLVNNVGVKIAPNRLKVIAPAIDLETVQEGMEQPLDHPWFVDGSPPVIITVARLSNEKNLHLLINAFAQLRQNIDCRLMILGEGTQRAELEELVRALGIDDVVEMPGFDENPWKYMTRAAVFVLTSTVEAFGRVLAESLACHTPVIATDAIGGGPRLILEEGRYGALIPPDDQAALVQAMARIISDKDYRECLNKLAFERVSTWEPTAVAKSWLDFAMTL